MLIKGFGEVMDNRAPVNKTKLDERKLECFNRILEHSHIYYERYETSDGVEYDFSSQAFGEWVEEQIVEFHSLKESDNQMRRKKNE